MRIAPLAFTDATDEEICEVSAITHAHRTSTDACVIFVELMRDVMNGALPSWALQLKGIPEQEIRSVKTAIGLDFSMSELYVDSNGAHADYPHFFRKSQEKLAREQRRLSHCEKGSSRYMKQKKKIARLHAHIARQRKDYLHKESRKITNFYDLVCIESLNMKEMSQDSRFGKSVHDNGWGMFTEFLSYKLERAGKKLVRIDKWYPSSKICSCCGKLKKELKLEDRIYRCTCGNQMNRDENAAINICREGLRISGVELDTERKAFHQCI